MVIYTWIKDAVAWLLGSFSVALPSIVGKFLAAFGMTMISFNAVLPNLKAFVVQYTAGMPAEAMNMLGALGVGQAVSMVVSALTVSWGAKMFIVPKSVADNLAGGGAP